MSDAVLDGLQQEAVAAGGDLGEAEETPATEIPDPAPAEDKPAAAAPADVKSAEEKPAEAAPVEDVRPAAVAEGAENAAE